ncbi:MAG TPA: reverse transcriptase family protein [Pyrinomonadaceae bacterium]|nr:reverse transcriptase family protein [Pyrinomonadaceae bacterium]
MSAEPPRTRQELYERIRQTSREEFILEEMIRLGFWPEQGVMPQDPAEEIRHRAQLQRELNDLRQENRRLHDEEGLLKELRRQRLAESRRKRKETKERRERERQERAAAWREKQGKEIVFLGEAVSGGLNHTECDAARLQSYGLPQFSTAAEIAAAAGLTVGELRFLIFDRKTSTVNHYVRFQVPKKTGGFRQISSPMPRLKAVQHWLLGHVLERVELHDCAHGFRQGRSIVSNARPHVGAETIINLDLQDFFPSISYRRVKGLFRSFGYSEAAATVFGLLCTEPTVEEVELDGRKYFVATGERHLPQGAPTSPAVTNALCRRLDRRLLKAAGDLGFAYTRYADDLTFSASGESLRHLGDVLARARAVVEHEGFSVHPAKTRVIRRSRRQDVTGVVVNSRPNVSRQELKRFRAALYQIEKDGPAGKRWGNAPDVIASIQGFANFVYMVNPDKGAELQRRVRSIIGKYGWEPVTLPRQTARPKSEPPQAHTDSSEANPSQVQPAEKKWWKLW